MLLQFIKKLEKVTQKLKTPKIEKINTYFRIFLEIMLQCVALDFQFESAYDGIIIIKKACTVHLSKFAIVLYLYCPVGLQGCHQLSTFRSFGRKTFRMRSLFVRSAGSSLLCKQGRKYSCYWCKFLHHLSWNKCWTLFTKVGSASAPSRSRTVLIFPLMAAAWRADEPF